MSALRGYVTWIAALATIILDAGHAVARSRRATQTGRRHHLTARRSGARHPACMDQGSGPFMTGRWGRRC